MAYRLKPDESTTRGLRRIARRELRAVIDRLREAGPPTEGAIHDARKRLKKARTIFNIVEGDRGSGLAKGSKRLRSVNRTLAELRDADAMLATLAALDQRNPRLFTRRTFECLRRRLSLHKEGLLDAAARGGTWKRVVRELRALRRQAASWTPSHRGFGALAAAIRSAHKRGRKALQHAERRGRAADFHEWRKAVKALWYALRLIEESGATVRRQVAALDRAQRHLGHDHDAAVLRKALAKEGAACEASFDRDRLEQAVARYQEERRRRALAGMRRFYARDSDAVVASVKRAWTAWVRHRGAAGATAPR
jgi:CHAD domain-containing protein